MGNLKTIMLAALAAGVATSAAAASHDDRIVLSSKSSRVRHHKHVYYGVGIGKHQTATGGPVGGITSRN